MRADDPIYGAHPTSAMPYLDYRSNRHMATTKKAFKTIPAGTSVTWHYRSAIGHGTVVGVHKMGTKADNTMYDGTPTTMASST